MTTTVVQERERDRDRDEIWCVLDHDERAAEIEDFRAWLRQQSSGKKRTAKIYATISTPCFEYWLLLHFKFTNQPFRGTSGGPSACDQVIRELETYLDGYRKADPKTYETDQGCTCIEHVAALWRKLPPKFWGDAVARSTA